MISKIIKNMTGAFICFAFSFAMHANAQWNPNAGWEDSYAVDGKCYCNSSNYDHNLHTKSALTPIGELNVVDICTDIKAALGEGSTTGRIPYNDIQCGNGPANDAADEAGCPGRVDIGSAGCNVIGPKWDLLSVYGAWPENPSSDALDRSAWEASSSHNQNDVYLAMDGQTSTRWATGQAQSNGQSFEVDMQSVRSFNSIVLESAANPNDYPRGYEVYVSMDGFSWGSPIAVGAGIASTTAITFDAAEARYFRIVQTGSSSNNWWSIHEINLYHEEVIPPIESEALDRSAWTVSASHNVDEAVLAIDGSTSTRWDSETPQSLGQWFEVDLNASYVIDSIELDSTVSSNDYPRSYSVFLSVDGEVWVEALTNGLGNGPVTNINFEETLTRFIRIEQTGSDSYYWWSIHNLNVFGVRSEAGELNRDAWILSASNNTSDLNNAIDGNEASRWATRQTQRDGQSFTIDMNAINSFDSVVLNSVGSDMDQPRAYEVSVSNDGLDWTTPVASGVGSTDGITVINFAAESARFIKVSQTGSDSQHWWSIHEVRVFNGG